MIRTYDCKIVLEDGSEYRGYRFGARVDRVCEIVFNTSMVGYQEIVSDPSYTDQMVVMTYPIIGNYGVTDEDFETKILTLGGLVVREYNDIPSNFRYTKTLSEILEDDGIPGVEGVDTRKLARAIRDGGCCRAILCDDCVSREEALARLAAWERPRDQVSRVSCRKRWYARTSNHEYNVVVVDCGMRLQLVRALNARGCNVTVVPCGTSAEAVLAMEPDGVLISNGPGDPADAAPVIELIRQLRGKLPVFGVCLGHQLIALACGAGTVKIKVGHRGATHAVRELATGRLAVVEENHGYAVDAGTLAGTGLEVTHVDLMDGTVEGLRCVKDRLRSVQFYPEAAAGRGGVGNLFDQFVETMKEGKGNA